jgi:asparagine synthase (glutamine-hydrolysing)
MLLRATPRYAINSVGRTLTRVLPARLAMDRAGDRAHKLAGILRHGDAWSIYLGLVATIADAPALVIGGSSPVTALTDPSELAASVVPDLDIETRMMQADIASYLVDDILVKVDRASMACGLEAREPLLDRELATLAFRLPLAMKIRGGERKWALRRVLERRVPRALFDRPKMGFGVPLAEWLRGPLRDWAEPLMAAPALEAAGFARPDIVASRWRSHLAGEADWSHPLWAVLVLQDWWRHWGSPPDAA